MSQETNRRQFLGLMGVSGAGLLAGAASTDAAAQTAPAEEKELPLIDSPPVLQCPTENSIAVVWAVGTPTAGYVEFGTDKENLDQAAFGDVFGLKAYNERFLQIRLEGLKPNTRYYYRTATCSFRYVNAYSFQRGEPVYSEVYSFVTPGVNQESCSFSVMNDTHQNQPTLKKLTARLAELDSDYTIWNGDLVHSVDSPKLVVEAMLRPGDAAFAAERPMLFVPGNHDYRGVWARNLHYALPTWEHSDPLDVKNGRNFVVRTGPLALIGLDTGEDKPDHHPAWAGQARFEPYRVAQRDWLARVVKRPEVATAPFIVAFCHIPIFDSNPNANGGDVLERWAQFQRQASNLWGPILSEVGAQVVVAAHTHRFRHDPASGDRKWAQIVGGGHQENGPITVIHGKADGEKLELAVDEINSGKELGRWTFPKRNV